MNVSYDWLAQYGELDLSEKELALLLPGIGMEVDAVREFTVNGILVDTVFELEMTANRPDLLSTIGVARELAAATGTPLKIPDISLRCGPHKAETLGTVELDAPDLCPHYTARIISDVTIAPSPPWLRQRLESIGLRPVNNVVDITNFVLMECGQPLHAFDFDKLRGRKIVVRRARPAEKITVIDGSVHQLTDQMLVIADAELPTAIAGVMGGLDTEISQSTSTILLESARFLPANIRRTSRALGLSSDSSYRFERSIDPCGVEWGSRRAAAMIADIAGGEVAEGFLEMGQGAAQEQVVSFRPERASRVLGVEIPAAQQRTMLERLGFHVADGPHGSYNVRIPSFRLEVAREIDLIEEVARAYGYDKIPEKTRMRVRAVPAQTFDDTSARVRDLCISLGFSEARTSSFIATELAARFTTWTPEVNVIRNPVNAEEPALRTSLIPQLLRAKRHNANQGAPDVTLFELSRVYQRSNDSPSELTCLALLDDAGFRSLRGALDALFDHLGLHDQVTYVARDDANLAPGRAAAVMLADHRLAVIGEVSDELARLFDLKTRPAVAEIDFDRLMTVANIDRRHRPLPKLPPVRRDLCVVVDHHISWAEIAACARAQAGDCAESVAFMSEYLGQQIGPGKKAIAFSVTLRAPDRTLTGEEADQAVRRVADALRTQFGATLRG